MTGFNLLSRLTFRYVLKILSIVSMSYLLISLDPLSTSIVYYGIAAGIGAGLAIPSLQVIAITGDPSGRRGLASAIYTAMFDLGNLVGPVVASALANIYRDMISVGGYLTIASAAPIAMITAKVILVGRSLRQ